MLGLTALVTLMHVSHSALIYVLAASAVALTGAVHDARTRRIPNKLTGPALFAGILLHFALDGWRGMGMAALAALIAFAVFLIFFLAGGMGAGDVKLMTAVACLAGSHFVVELLVTTAIAGGMMAVGMALARRRFQQTLSNVLMLISHHRHEGLQPHPELNVRSQKGLRLPYGLAIAAGCLFTLAATCVRG
jgi:prepilin peptidase CpaA